MRYAANNIFIPLSGVPATGYAIMNPMSGSFDLLSAAEYAEIMAGRPETLAPDLSAYMLERGYVFNTEAEEQTLREARWQDFQAEIADTQVQLMLIPSYGCNLDCAYCYQSAGQAAHDLISLETVEAFFRYSEKNFATLPRKPFITLFGGEPLINTKPHRRVIEQIVNGCNRYGYELAAVTNGYDLAEYLDILSPASIKEIQVTLDGTREHHNSRRSTRNGKGSFDRIVSGIDAAIEKGYAINLRTVIDQENMAGLTGLARFAEEKGWLDLPADRFKTQIGRNYELFDCYAKPHQLMSQAELWRDFALLAAREPLVRKFHRPEFKGIRHLVDSGEMYMASFDTCPAAKTEWVFDLYGDIYGCTASCGRSEFKLGQFYPIDELHTAVVDQWRTRNVNNIEECRACKYNVVCGGGCGVIAARRTGRILAPDCRPIQQILETGVHYYCSELQAMAEQPGQAIESTCCGNSGGAIPIDLP